MAGRWSSWAGANADQVVTALEAELAKLPRVQGGDEPRIGRRLPAFFAAAEDEAKKLKDEFVSTEHFLLAASKDKAEAGPHSGGLWPFPRQAARSSAEGARQPAGFGQGPGGEVPGARQVHPRSHGAGHAQARSIR